jgi:hypothetical protein
MLSRVGGAAVSYRTAPHRQCPLSKVPPRSFTSRSMPRFVNPRDSSPALGRQATYQRSGIPDEGESRFQRCSGPFSQAACPSIIVGQQAQFVDFTQRAPVGSRLPRQIFDHKTKASYERSVCLWILSFAKQEYRYSRVIHRVISMVRDPLRIPAGIVCLSST